jgi:UDP-GlcNAc:undecaprenyl-phosphate GlcNAc-1-phosphate transferase
MFLLVCFMSFIITLTILPLLKKSSFKLGIFDNPADDGLKIHKQAMPLVGGAAFFIATLTSMLIATAFINNVVLPIGVVVGAIMSFGLGLLDDLFWKNANNVFACFKFVAQVSISLVVIILLFRVGLQIQFIPFSAVAILLGMFYMMGGINAINMQDGIDGLAGGLVALSAIGFMALSIQTDNTLGLVLSLSVLGGVLGFLIYNFPPASVFMGDSGSHFLGFMMALLAVIFTSQRYDFQRFVGPILILGLPVFDAAFAVIRRAVFSRPLFKGDRSHIYDCMLRKGFDVRKTVLMCYLIQLAFVATGLMLYI